MEQSFINKRNIARPIALLTVGLFFLLGAGFSQAVVDAPVLQDPTASCSGSNPFVTLNWSGVTGAHSYDIFRDAGSSPIDNVGVTTYDDIAVGAPETHTYYIVAKKASGEASLPSNSKTITVPRCGPVLQLVNKSCLVDGPRIDLGWNALAGTSGYAVFRDGSTIGQAASSETTFSDTTAVGDQNYSYTVRASWPDGDTKDSNTLTQVTAPACPVTLSGSGDCNAPGKEASLSWNGLDGVINYQIFKGGSFLTSVTGTSFADTNVQQNSSFSYFIRAIYSIDSADSNQITADVPRCAPVLTAQNTCNADNPNIPEVLLSWSDTADANYYNLYEVGVGKGQIPGQVPNGPSPITATVTSFDDGTKVQNNTTYTFNVQATGAFPTFTSNNADVTTNCSINALPSPAPVLSLTPICRGSPLDSQMDLSWTPSNNVLYYVVERTNNADGSQTGWNVLGSDTSATDPNVEIGVSYSYRVIAHGNGGDVPSNTATKTSVDCTLPSIPTLAAPSPQCVSGQPQVNLSWDKSTNATNYEVWRDGTKINDIGDPNTVTYTDKSVTNSTNYNSPGYEIRAVGPGGTTPSGAKTATTPNCNPPTAPVLTISSPFCTGTGVSISLSWTVSANASYYNVYRKRTGDASFSPILSNFTGTSYVNTGLAQNIAEVDYYVEAVGVGGTKNSDMLFRSTPYCSPPPQAVTVGAACLANQSVMNVSWSNLKAGLVASYGFDEGVGGTAYDNTGGGKNATLTNISNPPTALSGWTSSGKNGGALAFDGVNDYTTSSGFADLGTSNRPYSITGWVNVASGETAGNIVHTSGQADGGGWCVSMVTLLANSKLRSNSWTGVSSSATSNTTLLADTWYHFATTWDPTNGLRIFVNGLLERTTAQSTFSASGVSNFVQIARNPGGCSGNQGWFNGKVDDVHIYNRALSESEVQTDFMASSVAAVGTISSFEILRDGNLIATVPSSSSTYQDGSSVNAGQNYSYAVNAVGPGGSAPSSTVSKQAIECGLPSKPVINLSSACVASVPSVTVSWAATTNTNYYDVYRNGAKIAGNLSDTTYTDQGSLLINTSYSYKVIAVGPGGNNESETESITTAACPPPAVTLSAAPICVAGNSAMNLSWGLPTANLSAAYNFDQGSGTTLTDFSGNANNGAISNPVWVAGKNNGSLSFDGGAASYVNLGNTASLQVTGNQTIEMWIKPTDFAARRNPYAKAYSGEGALTVETNGEVSYFFGKDGCNCGSQYTYAGLTGGGRLSAGAWAHIAIVRDFSTMQMRWYKNGTLITTTAIPAGWTSAATSALNATIATGYAGNFKGQIDDLRVYGRVLTQAQIQTDMNTPVASSAGTITSYEVYRGGSLIATLSSSASSYQDSGLTANQSYDYVVNAVGPGGSTPSNMVSPTASDCSLPPQPVISLSTSCDNYVPGVGISWSPVANANYYDVYRGGVKIAGNVTGTSYRDQGSLSINTSYTYKLTAVGTSGSTDSDPVGITSATCSPNPVSVSATPACSAAQSVVNLSWDPKLAAAYNFNEGSGAATADISGNANTGAVSGASWTVGKYGQGLNFNGINNYVNVGNKAGLNLTNNFTVEAWIYPTGQGSAGASGGIIVNKESVYEIGRFGNGSIRWAFQWNNGVGWLWNDTGINAPLNQWTHVAITFSPTAQIKAYKNGVLASTVQGQASLLTNANSLWIGGRSGFSQFFQGNIDEVRIYNGRTLAQGEIQLDMNTPVSPSNGAITSYEVMRNMALATTLLPSVMTYQDADGLAADQTYTYSVNAVGPGGRIPSSDVPATTADCSAPDKPVISSVAGACVGGTALNVDGANGHVSIPDHAQLRLTGDMTVMSWVYLNARASNWTRLVGKGSSATGMRNYGLWVYGPDGRILFQIGNVATNQWANAGTSWGTVTNALSMSLSQWYLLTGVKQGGTIYLYLNGTLVASTAIGFPVPTSNADPLKLGFYDSTYPLHNGALDEVKIYSRALSAAEITAAYDSGRGQYGAGDPNLIAAYHLDEGSGTTVSDYGNNPKDNGTLVGASSWASSPVAVASGSSGSFEQVKVDWGKATNAASYEVYRNGVKIATVPVIDASQLTYTYYDRYSVSNALAAGANYTYKITAKNSIGTGVDSDPQSTGALAQCKPTTPLWSGGYPRAVCSTGLSTISTNWVYTQPFSQTQSFEVRRDDGAGNIATKTVASNNTGNQSFVDDASGAGLTQETNYSYQVNAVGPTGLRSSGAEARSVQSNVCSIAAPSYASQCTVSGFNPVTLIAWEKTSADTSFLVMRKKSGEASFSAINPASPTIYNYSVSSPTTIREWLLLGTFANPGDDGAIRTYFDKDYLAQDPGGIASETNIMPRDQETTSGKVWKRIVVSSTSDYVDLAAAYGNPTYVVGYAFAYIYSPSAAGGQLRLGSDDGIKAYLNGVEVWNNHKHRAAARDQDTAPVSLKAGVNTLLLKIDQGGGGWGFYARLTDSSGNPLISTIASTDSAAPSNQSADYFVSGSPTAMTSLVTSVPAFNCLPEGAAVALAPACNAQATVMNVNWGSTKNTSSYNVFRVGRALPLNASPIPYTVGQATYSFTDGDIEADKDYSYYVMSIGNGSTPSASVTDTSLSCVTKPDKPDLTAANVEPYCAGTASRVFLDWPDAANAISYKAYRDETVFLSPTASQALDDGVTGGNQYVYKVEAIGSGGSSFSNEITVEALNCSGPPAPPVLNSASALPRTTNVLLNWTDNSINEEGFRVQRSTAVGLLKAKSMIAQVFSPLNLFAAVFNTVSPDLPVDSTSWLDSPASDATPPQEDATYDYQIGSFNSASPTAQFSNILQVHVPILPPGDFTLAPACNSNGKKVDLDWTAAATTAKGGQVTYNAFWAEDQAGSYAILPSPCSVDITRLTCKTDVPKKGVNLWYKVTATNNGGSTDAFNIALCAPPPPKYKEIRPPE